MTAPSASTASASSSVAATASAGALVATDLTHAYGERTVLAGVSLVAPPGRRIGLVGDNGVGKSTLLRLLAGVEAADAGHIERPPDTALLEQELPHPPETTIHQVVEEALAELRDATRRVAELAALVQRLPDDEALAREYGDELEWAQARDAWDADHRVDRVLRGLGLAHMPRNLPIGGLSGGERARIAMAALLVRQPRALLLDEPTNHLDDAGLEYVERHLRGLPGVVVVSSHDRTFLDAVCTDIVDLDPARDGPTRHAGSFSDYLDARHAARRRWEQAWLDRQAELRTLHESLGTTTRQVGHQRPRRDNDKTAHNFRGARAERGVARRVRNALGRIEQLERRPFPRPPEPLRFAGQVGAVAEAHEGPVLAAVDVSVTGRLARVSVELGAASRLLVTGRNGAGKSTLLATLAGLLDPTGGTVEVAAGARVGLLAQHSVFPDPSATPVQVYAAATQHRADVVALEDLGLLREADLRRPVGVLSEGQRRRLALAVLVAQSPSVLLLDEPTNHLSPTLVSELEEALLAAPCAVVVATHDRWLRSRWPGGELRLEPARAVGVSA